MKGWLLIFVALFVVGCAQKPPAEKQLLPEAGTANKTKLAAFTEKRGRVIIKGYSEVGEIKNRLGTTNIEAVELRDVSDPTSKATGATFRIQRIGFGAVKETVQVDYDELESLVQGLDYIAKVDSSATKLENFEAHYITTGGLQITVFSNGAGKSSAAVSAAGTLGVTSHFLTMEEFAKLRGFVADTRTTLDRAR